MQLHFVRLHDAEPAMRLLSDVGLTTREACGNSVRNITACPHAGVARDEVFDVTPYAEAMTRYLLRHPLSSVLPRKFKIAFEGCTSEDHAATSINDLGWRAMMAPDGSGRRGFRVQVAGGTAIMCRSGASLYEFLPGIRDSDGGRSGAARLSKARRLRTQAAQSLEVSREVDGMGGVARGVPARARRSSRKRRRSIAVRSRRIRLSKSRRRANVLRHRRLRTLPRSSRPARSRARASSPKSTRLTAIRDASGRNGCDRTCGHRSRASIAR